MGKFHFVSLHCLISVGTTALNTLSYISCIPSVLHGWAFLARQSQTGGCPLLTASPQLEQSFLWPPARSPLLAGTPVWLCGLQPVPEYKEQMHMNSLHMKTAAPHIWNNKSPKALVIIISLLCVCAYFMTYIYWEGTMVESLWQP